MRSHGDNELQRIVIRYEECRERPSGLPRFKQLPKWAAWATRLPFRFLFSGFLAQALHLT